MFSFVVEIYHTLVTLLKWIKRWTAKTSHPRVIVLVTFLSGFSSFDVILRLILGLFQAIILLSLRLKTMFCSKRFTLCS